MFTNSSIIPSNQPEDNTPSYLKYLNPDQEEYKDLINKLQTFLISTPIEKRKIAAGIVREHKNELGLYNYNHVSSLAQEVKETEFVHSDEELAGWLWNSDEFFDDVKSREFLIQNFIAKNQTTMLSGEPNAGKNTLVCSLTVALCDGEEFFGEELEQSTVIFHSSDESPSVLSRRLVEMGLNNRHNFFPIIKNNFSGELWSVLHLGILEKYFLKAKRDRPGQPIVFILDSVTSAISEPTSSELTSEGINKHINNLIQLCRSYEVTLILLHHTNSSGRPFGIVTKSIDTSWLIERVNKEDFNNKQRSLRLSKNRDLGEIPSKIVYEMDADTKKMVVIDLPEESIIERKKIPSKKEKILLQIKAIMR